MPGHDEREACASKSRSFYAVTICENAVAHERSTKEFCEIAAAVISPSYSAVRAVVLSVDRTSKLGVTI
jgi:hypothetical protein